MHAAHVLGACPARGRGTEEVGHAADGVGTPGRCAAGAAAAVDAPHGVEGSCRPLLQHTGLLAAVAAPPRGFGTNRSLERASPPTADPASVEQGRFLVLKLDRHNCAAAVRKMCALAPGARWPLGRSGGDAALVQRRGEITL